MQGVRVSSINVSKFTSRVCPQHTLGAKFQINAHLVDKRVARSVSGMMVVSCCVVVCRKIQVGHDIYMTQWRSQDICDEGAQLRLHITS